MRAKQERSWGMQLTLVQRVASGAFLLGLLWLGY